MLSGRISVLLAVVALCGSVQVDLAPGQEYMIESDNYPEPAAANLRRTWTLTSPPDTQVKIKCIDVRLFQDDDTKACNAGDILTIDDGKEKHELCGARYDDYFYSTGNTMNVALETGPYPSGGVSCRATVLSRETPTERVTVSWTEPTTEAREPTPLEERALYLPPDGPAVSLTTRDYPAHAEAFSNQKWNLKTDEGSTIRVTCNDIRIFKGPEPGTCDEDEQVEILDGDYVKRMCGSVYDYTYLTTGNTLSVRIAKGSHRGGGVKCNVQGRLMDWYGEVTTPHYLNVESEEVDSSEHGGPPGPKSTTCPCGTANKASKRIINGVETAVNEFPFIAAIVTKQNLGQFCGGSIITPYHVVTAAHCTWKFVAANVPLAVIVGEHNLVTKTESNFTEVIPVTKIIEHADFHKVSLVHDIALLVLENKITYNMYVAPVCLPPQGWVELTRKYVTIIGWGALKWRGPSPDALQKVHNRVVHWDTCRNVFSYMVKEVKSQICTFGNNKGACNGDSGGPVVWVDPDTNRYTLVGLVSYTTVCASNHPTVHTAVSAYIDWLQARIKETMPAETCSKV